MPIMRDFAVATVLVVLVGTIPSKAVSELENNFLGLLFAFAIGLGTKETLPSLSREPVPRDAMGELV